MTAAQKRLRSLGWCLLVLFSLFAGIANSQNDWDFELIIRNAERQYGKLSILTRDRLYEWAELISSSEGRAESEQLEAVNHFFNRQFRFLDDQSNWNQHDYWATPVEASIKGAADCEDYSLAKYFTLRRLGIPSAKLRITYVKALKENRAHMVLTYYATPTADPLVLDNLIPEILPASQRRDLLPVYAFNAEGLYIPGKRNGDSKRLSRWQNVLKKMQAEGFPVGEG